MSDKEQIGTATVEEVDEAGFGDGEDPELESSLETAPSGIPDWCPVPAGFAPPIGRKPIFVRLRAEWTDNPHVGDRTLIMWTLSSREEKIGFERGQGQPTSAIQEMAKMTIRVIDGSKVDPSRKQLVDQFWQDIGPGCRQMLTNLYLKTHSLNEDQRKDFFANCIAVGSAVPG